MNYWDNYKTLKLTVWVEQFEPNQINKDKIKDYLECIQQFIKNYDSTKYSEKHHIMPRCIDKDKKYLKEVVKISGADHFRAHMKLIECFNGQIKFKLSSALMFMSKSKRIQDLSPEEYEMGKSLFVTNMKEFLPDYHGTNNPFYGKKHTESAKERNRIAHLKENLSPDTLCKMSQHHRDVSGINNPMASKSSRLKVSAKMKGKPKSESHKKNLSLAFKGKRTKENNAFYGKKHTEQSIEKMRKAKLGSNNPNYGTIWITDGVHSKHMNPNEDIPPGWRRGRVRKQP